MAEREGAPPQRSDLYSWAMNQARVAEQRGRIGRRLRRNPGLQERLEEALDEAYEDARFEAATETDLPLSVSPETRMFDFAEIMARPVVRSGDET